MFDILGEGSTGLKFVFAFIVVLALIALTAWLVRRFGSERLGGTGTTRGRQPRLAVIDAASVDGRRRLVLIRRDNVEHLMMIGGPTDVVVEANIVRAAARETQAPRGPAAIDTLPRAVPLGEGSQWPLQPEPAPAARAEPPVLRMESPAPRMELPRAEPPMPRAPQRHGSAPPPAPAAAEEETEWAAAEPEPPPPAPPPPPQAVPQRRARLAPAQDALAGLADELARAQPPQPEPAASELRAARRDPRIARSSQAAAPPSPPPAPPAPVPAEGQFNSPADQNLAEMAQRLEAALRQPGPRAAPAYEPQQQAEPEDHAPPPPPPRPPVPAEGRPARPARADRAPAAAAPKSSLYDSLEQEMASLLGRPNSKS